MRDPAATIRIELLGKFRITCADGQELTLTGAKNQGIIAMLALAPDQRRSRRWLARHLWSTFRDEQASANLRQALRKLRKMLGPCTGILLCDGEELGLDSSRVTVDLFDAAQPNGSGMELLPGLEPRDPAFSAWLQQERATWRDRGLLAVRQSERGVAIRCVFDQSTAPSDRLLAEYTADGIAASIIEQVRAWRQADTGSVGKPLPDCDVLLSCNLSRADYTRAAFVRAIDLRTGEILLSETHPLSDDDQLRQATPELSRLIYQSAERVLSRLPQALGLNRPEARATALSRLALKRLFGFERDETRKACALFEKAYRLDHSGVYLAWHGMARLTQLIEKLEPDTKALQEQITELSLQALRSDASNPLVQALVSKTVSTIGGDVSGGMDLARCSVAGNPHSPYAWKALAEAHMACGDPVAALSASSNALEIVRYSPFRHWWDISHALINLSCERYDDAIAAAETTLRGSPKSRPALRSLIALYTRCERLDDAMHAAKRLGEIEPGFTLELLVNDPAYPVPVLREKDLLTPIRALL
ncbi:transcriptional regulator [Salipiger sp. 1_MG-2023]|uniref:transcriptional regulator n=1 Tax=Salipiger sp. 1_MG-2023 TaxID=3062665 RepID=UPI0026E34D1B|nr:transcriptional regulator [Salipiger sp. 1_MG-2023]MDO6587465.1 transcriptional regulator [Salipiger sp. 1_MG-2023]